MLLPVKDRGKKQKLHLEKDINDREDVISSLPDCVLSHILSFLPTKDAVGTCILSTRWQDLWIGLPNIDFDDSLMYHKSLNHNEKLIRPFDSAPFLDFVERVLIHRDITNITRFRLSCRVWSETRVSAWISSAIQWNVKELELCLKSQTQFYLPHCVFNCPSLVTLKICTECVLKLPEIVVLPNLRTLYLGAVEFSDEESACKLFAGCPSLEELKLIDCDWEKLESITISIPTLKRLRIDELFYLLSLDKRSDCVIKMKLPNLVSFEYLGDLLNGIVIENQLSQLTDATVFVLEKPGSKFDLAPDVFNLFITLKHITVLRVSSSTIKSLFVAESFLGQLPVFLKLTRLELNVDIQDICPETLMKFLLSFPYLEFLAFHEEAASDLPHRHGDFCSLVFASRCNLPRLKMVNILFLHGGNMAELRLLRSLVDIAPALEKVSICCSRCDSDQKKEIAVKVQTLLDYSRGKIAVQLL